MITEATDISWLRLGMAFSVVLALLAGLGFVLKYIAARGISFSFQKQRARRLKIVETLALDTRRRIAIVRCDENEHLLLLSAGQDIVIQANLPPTPRSS